MLYFDLVYLVCDDLVDFLVFVCIYLNDGFWFYCVSSCSCCLSCLWCGVVDVFCIVIFSVCWLFIRIISFFFRVIVV